MRIPRYIYIKGKRWKVVYRKRLTQDGDPCSGLCDLENRIIYLSKLLSPKERTATIFHELFHALLFECHVPEGASLNEEVEEILCDAFADFIMSNLSNPKLKRRK